MCSHASCHLQCRHPIPDRSRGSGPTPDGNGSFGYRDEPMVGVPMPPLTNPDARFYGTTEEPNLVEKAAGAVQDKLKKE
ncbi:hypothetical protein GCM10011374_38800 [Kocuria dechangensis]|uniref:Uncharacterized protein n=1 Tax=Kocuria dechangensis TaxID=1176249 RepID=A0A917H814_9MICC|nr:hypothetical protein GCM10011374_38800 [Kocuria dechangensis]